MIIDSSHEQNINLKALIVQRGPPQEQWPENNNNKQHRICKQHEKEKAQSSISRLESGHGWMLLRKHSWLIGSWLMCPSLISGVRWGLSAINNRLLIPDTPERTCWLQEIITILQLFRWVNRNIEDTFHNSSGLESKHSQWHQKVSNDWYHDSDHWTVMSGVDVVSA